MLRRKAVLQGGGQADGGQADGAGEGARGEKEGDAEGKCIKRAYGYYNVFYDRKTKVMKSFFICLRTH